MLVNSQGFEHFLQHFNNQDFSLETSRMLLVLDGCSGAKFSEVGTRLFAQLFSRKEEYDSLEKFESNVKETFDDLIEMMRKHYANSKELENDFILENLLFTIIGCFETDDKYVVKMFGDGYIITQNLKDRLSYMKFSYGKCPPYFAYKYCEYLDPNVFKDYEFKTFEFDKKLFKGVGIASDGILPIVKGTVTGADVQILKRDNLGLGIAIQTQIQQFSDDVTIAFFNKKIPNNVEKMKQVQEDSVVKASKEKLQEKHEVKIDALAKRVDEMNDLEIVLFGEKVVIPQVQIPQTVTATNKALENTTVAEVATSKASENAAVAEVATSKVLESTTVAEAVTSKALESGDNKISPKGEKKNLEE